MDEIAEIAREKEVDAVVVAGDLYDTFNPSAEAIELLYGALHRLADGGKRLVIAIAGNHDSPDRVDSPDVLARRHGIYFVGNPLTELRGGVTDAGVELIRADEGFAEFRLPGCACPLRVVHTPYANGIRLRRFLGVEDQEVGLREVLREHWGAIAGKYCDEEGVNILVAHLYVMREGGEMPDEPEDERPIRIGGADAVYSSLIPSGVQYAALGHLHRWQTVDTEPCPVVYSGSPLSYSFSEAGQQKYVTIVDAEPGQAARVERCPLTSGRMLVCERFEGVEAAVRWLTDHPEVWVELTVATNTYLTAAEAKAIRSAHEGIIQLISEVKEAAATDERVASIHDLRSDVNALFAEYFRCRKGQEPNEEIMALFRETLSIE